SYTYILTAKVIASFLKQLTLVSEFDFIKKMTKK
ncbi:MAG: hypothetical protein RIT30_339, partial [Bacteroidota bacterium]